MSTMQPQQQQQQPVVFYPNPVVGQQQPSSHSSNGSFGTVFIVLAVIVVVSAIACCLGRVCSRHKNKQKYPSTKHKQQQQQQQQQQKQNHNKVRPGGDSREADIEFGFGKGFPGAASRPVGYGGDHIPRVQKPFENGHAMNGHVFKGEPNNPVDVGGPRPARGPDLHYQV